MKRLHLIRHAKSSWNDFGLSDIDRPLNDRGVRATAIMAPSIVGAGWKPDAVFVSAAVRARTTIELIASHLPDTDITPAIDEDLYTFSASALLDWCNALPEDLSNVTIVGHNPATTSLTNRLTGSAIANVPTCGYIQMQFDGPWKDLDRDGATLNEFLTPKMVKARS